MAKLLTADHQFITVRPTRGRTFTGEELRALVGGEFAVVITWRGRPLVVRAQQDGPPRNSWASAITPTVTLWGDAVLCKPSELAGLADSTDLSVMDLRRGR